MADHNSPTNQTNYCEIKKEGTNETGSLSIDVLKSFVLFWGLSGKLIFQIGVPLHNVIL